MGRKTITSELEKKIVRYLKDHSQQATARHFKISPSTVNGIVAKRPAMKAIANHSAPKIAIAAHKEYAREDRIQVLHKLMRRVDLAIDDPELKPGGVRDLTVALGTLLDKYRLEEKDTDETSRGEALDLLTKLRGADARAS
jgi:hypothetical protein